jgi:hypothetical protein
LQICRCAGVNRRNHQTSVIGNNFFAGCGEFTTHISNIAEARMKEVRQTFFFAPLVRAGFCQITR